jgi:hypothetical protein
MNRNGRPRALSHCLFCNDDVYPFFHSIYNSSLCAYLFTSHSLLYSPLPSVCPSFIYTIILDFFYAIYPTPTTFVFLYCVVFFSKLYSSSFRLFTPYTIFFYSLLLSPPFHFPFLRNYEMDLAFIRKSFASLLHRSTLQHLNYQDKLLSTPLYRLSTVQDLSLKFSSPG